MKRLATTAAIALLTLTGMVGAALNTQPVKQNVPDLVGVIEAIDSATEVARANATQGPVQFVSYDGQTLVVMVQDPVPHLVYLEKGEELDPFMEDDNLLPPHPERPSPGQWIILVDWGPPGEGGDGDWDEVRTIG